MGFLVIDPSHRIGYEVVTRIRTGHGSALTVQSFLLLMYLDCIIVHSLVKHLTYGFYFGILRYTSGDGMKKCSSLSW